MVTSLILTTHRRPDDAARVLKELARTCWRRWESIELIVVGHEEEDKPTGIDQGFQWGFEWFVNKDGKGCARSVHYGVVRAVGDWFVWLCDDHQYPDADWFEKFLIYRAENPGVKVIAFDSGYGIKDCAPIGAAERKWYLEHYPEPVYEHYGWDNEIQGLAVKEGVFGGAYHILIQDRPGNPIQELKDRDAPLWEKRRAEFGI